MEGEEKETSNQDTLSTTGASAGKEDENSWWGGWGQGWIDTVKEKSASTLEMVKKDLNEFVEVIQGDTSVVMNETAEKLDEHVKKGEDEVKKPKDVKPHHLNTAEFVSQGVKGLSQVLHSMSELMSVQEPDDSNDEFITLSEGSFSLQSYNRKQEKLHIIQTDPGTYCNEPEGSFADWLEVFFLDEHKEDMSNLLTQNPAIRAVYSQLVPNVVSHTTFWQRYYYQVFLLDSEERKREELLARANNGAKNAEDDEDDDGGWGDDDDDDIEVVKPDPNIVVQSQDKKDTIEILPVKEDNKLSTEVNIEKDNTNEMKNKFDLISTEKYNNSADINTPSPQTMRHEIIDTTEQNLTCSKPDIEKKTNEDEPTALEKSYDTIQPTKTKHTFESIDQIDSIKTPKVELDSSDKDNKISIASAFQENENLKAELSETGSVSSWMSIDDDIKVKKIKGEQTIKNDTRPNSDGGSSNSSGVLINKSEADDMDDDDFDIDLDDVDDVNEEELAKMVEEIKSKSATGKLEDDDDDWENWE